MHKGVLARLTRPNRRQNMPVVRSAHDDSVDVFVVQKLANVDVSVAFFLAVFEFLHLRIKVSPLRIA